MITIDQSKIDAPDFPRSQEWWRKFVPEWADVTVREDGTVQLTGTGVAHPSQGPKRPATVRRSQEAALRRWLNPRLAVAVVEPDPA